MQDLYKQYSANFFSFWELVFKSGYGLLAVVGLLILLLTPVWMSTFRWLRERARLAAERRRAKTEWAAARTALRAKCPEKAERAVKVLALLLDRQAAGDSEPSAGQPDDVAPDDGSG